MADSFHGTCIAIVYKIPFLFIKGAMTEEVGLGRVTSLLKLLGIQDRIVPTVQDALNDMEKYTQDIDWVSVYEKLEKEKSRCLNWLKNALESEKAV